MSEGTQYEKTNGVFTQAGGFYPDPQPTNDKTPIKTPGDPGESQPETRNRGDVLFPDKIYRSHPRPAGKVPPFYPPRGNKLWSIGDRIVLIESACRGESWQRITELLQRTTKAVKLEFTRLVNTARIDPDDLKLIPLAVRDILKTYIGKLDAADAKPQNHAKPTCKNQSQILEQYRTISRRLNALTVEVRKIDNCRMDRLANYLLLAQKIANREITFRVLTISGLSVDAIHIIGKLHDEILADRNDRRSKALADRKHSQPETDQEIGEV